jgi:uncharacterized OsmC-like protein
MNEPKIKRRPTGAIAVLGRLGHPDLTTPTGGTLGVVTGASDPGFNPLDLMYSSLAACLALSTRIAASHMGVLDRFEKVSAHVTGEKSDGEPSRIVRFDIRLDILGDFDAQTRLALAHEAEAICTVSNTLRGNVEFTITVEG